MVSTSSCNIAPDIRAGGGAPAGKSTVHPRNCEVATCRFEVRTSTEVFDRLSCPRSADTALTLNLPPTQPADRQALPGKVSAACSGFPHRLTLGLDWGWTDWIGAATPVGDLYPLVSMQHKSDAALIWRDSCHAKRLLQTNQTRDMTITTTLILSIK